MARKYHFNLEIASIAGAVDMENGVIEGVSVITSGVQAKGHNLEVDDTTLEQMLEQGRSGSGKVPVKWNHKTGADAVNGYFTDFRRVGNKLKADWHLLKSHSQYEQAMELAERMPENVGFSASFMGLSELEDGTKVYNPDEKSKTHYTMSGKTRVPVPAGTKIFARCEELISVDLVATPAANPDGMFERGPVDSGGEVMAKTTTAGDPATDDDAAKILLGEFRQFAAGVNQRLTHLEEAIEADPDEEEEEEEEEEEPGAGGEGGADLSQFSDMREFANYFEARLDKAESDKRRQEFDRAVHDLEEKQTQLIEVNQQLLEENQILAEAYQLLSTKTKSVVEFSTGANGQPVTAVKTQEGRKLTEFEKRVAALQAEGKSYGEAMLAAVDEDAERYTTHLQAKGAIQQA